LTNVGKYRRIFLQIDWDLVEQANFLFIEEYAGLFQAAGY
jgi:hypothetical protein